MEKKTIIIGAVVVILLGLLVFFSGRFSLLSGQASPMVFDKFVCDRQDWCDTAIAENLRLGEGIYGCGCRNNGYLANDGYNSLCKRKENAKYWGSSGDNTIYGHVEVIPNCGVYLLSYNLKACGTKNGQCEASLQVNGQQIDIVRTGSSSSSVNSIVIDKDISNLVGGRSNVSIIAYTEANDNVDCSNSLASAELNDLTIKSLECEGDRYYVKTCPLFNGTGVAGIKFDSGENISLQRLPNDAYFCGQLQAIIEDSTGQVIGKDSKIYETLNNDGSYVVPSGQKMIVLYITQSTESSAKAVALLQGQVAEQADLIKQLGVTQEEQAKIIEGLDISIKEQAELIEAMELTQAEQVEIVKGLELSIQQQADMINELTENLAQKSYWVNQLQSENEIQAKLIIAMKESFTNQGIILDNMDLTIQEDAVIIKNLGLNLDQQAELINNLKRTNEEKALIVGELTSNIQLQSDLINKLDLTNKEKQDIIYKLQNNLLEQQGIIDSLSGKIGFYQKVILGIIGVVVLIALFIWWKKK